MRAAHERKRIEPFFMSILERISRAPQWLRRRLAPGGLILLYHRVSEDSSDPYSLTATPSHFAEHMEVLRKLARPMRLEEMIRHILDGRRPARGVVVTFDDGYADNLHNAKPLLEKYEIPATVFVASGHVGRGQEFWWDELDRLLLQPGKLPEALSLQVRDESLSWELGAAASYDAEDFRRHSNWNAWQESDPTPRHTLYRALHGLLQPLSEVERGEKMKEILFWAGACDAAAARPGAAAHRPGRRLPHQLPRDAAACPG